MTWGYFDGDLYNPDLYKNFTAMQSRISQGYYLYLRLLLATGSSTVKIAPAGLAFQKIHDQIIVEQGEDPLATGSLFDQLYERNEDPRKHPSLIGSYLIGCVLFQTLTGLDVRQTVYAPNGITDEQRQTLQQVAYETVMEFEQEQRPTIYPLPPSMMTLPPYSTSTPATTKPPYPATTTTNSDYDKGNYDNTNTDLNNSSLLSSSLYLYLALMAMVGGGFLGLFVGWKKRRQTYYSAVHMTERNFNNHDWDAMNCSDRDLSADYSVELTDIHKQ